MVIAARLFVYTRHRQSPADVSRLLSLVWCEMRCLCWEQAMCERKAKKDAPAAVVSRAACVSRAPPADASRPALLGWGRPAKSLRVNLFSTIIELCLHWHSEFQRRNRLLRKRRITNHSHTTKSSIRSTLVPVSQESTLCSSLAGNSQSDTSSSTK